MNQQERLKKLFEENAMSPNIFLDGDSQDCVVLENVIDCDTFIRVASELLEEREKGKNEPIKDCGCRCADDCSYTSEERKTEKPDYCRIVNGKHNL